MTNKHKKYENWGVNLGLWDCPKLVHLIPSVNSEIAAPAFQIVERSPIEKGGLGTVKKKESGLGRVAFRTPRTGTYFLSSIQCRRDHLLYPNTLGQCLLLLHRVLVWSVDWTRWLLWPGKLAVFKTKSQVSTIIYKCLLSYRRNTTQISSTNWKKKHILILPLILRGR